MVQAFDGDPARLGLRQIAPVRADEDRGIVAPDSVGFLQIGFAVLRAVVHPRSVDEEAVGVRPLGEFHVSDKVAGAVGLMGMAVSDHLLNSPPTATVRGCAPAGGSYSKRCI